MSNKLILVGAFNEIIELCESLDYNIIGIIDNVVKNEFKGYPIIGTDKDAKSLFPLYGEFPLVIVPDQPQVREKLAAHYSDIGYHFKSLISKYAFISPSAIIGEGVVIQNKVYVSSNVVISDFVKINVGATIMHDVVIGSFSTIAPCAVALGVVKIASKCYIGTNSTLLPTVNISEYVVVGANAVVTKSIEKNKIVKGVPAK